MSLQQFVILQSNIIDILAMHEKKQTVENSVLVLEWFTSGWCPFYTLLVSLPKRVVQIVCFDTELLHSFFEIKQLSVDFKKFQITFRTIITSFQRKWIAYYLSKVLFL